MFVWFVRVLETACSNMLLESINRPTAVKGPETEPEAAEGETSGSWREK